MDVNEKPPRTEKEEKEELFTSRENGYHGDEGCGLGSWQPRALRRLATLPVFTTCYSVGALLTSTLIVYVNSQVTTLERQFGFRSSQTGLILAANDIGFLLSTLFIGYLAPRVNIPRWLSISVILFGISGIICSFPHFLFGVDTSVAMEDMSKKPEMRIPTGQMCAAANQSDCLIDTSVTKATRGYAISGVSAKTSLWIIVIGMILQGVAKGPRHPFLVYYLDNNTDRSRTGFFLGIIISSAIFGPAIAFTLGGLFTKLYVTLEDVNMSPRHPRWIGAWWLGYVVFGLAAIIMGLPLLFFPKYLNGRTPPKDDPAKNAPKFDSWKGFLENAKCFGILLMKIFKNPVFIMLQVTSCLHMFAVAGSRSFLPKYVENQFNLTTWKTNLIIAGLSMTTASLGTFVGGWLTKQFRLTPVGNLKYVIVINFIIVLLKCLGFVFGCDQPTILNTPGEPADCYNNCTCDDEEFFPICSDDGRNFFSPCHAGCQISDGNTYSNCSCIETGGARAGLCPSDCGFLYPYMVLSAVVTLLGTTCIVPKYITIIRCVPEEQKPLATSLISFFSSLFGWLLGPILYGKIIDSICLYWDRQCDGQAGACTLYDIVVFRYKFHGFVIVIDFLSVILMGVAVFIARSRPHMNVIVDAKGNEIKGKGDNSPVDGEPKVKSVNGNEKGDVFAVENRKDCFWNGDGKGDNLMNENGRGDYLVNGDGKGDNMVNEIEKGDNLVNGNGDKLVDDHGKGDNLVLENEKGNNLSNGDGKGDNLVTENEKIRYRDQRKGHNVTENDKGDNSVNGNEPIP